MATGDEVYGKDRRWPMIDTEQAAKRGAARVCHTVRRIGCTAISI